MMLNKYDVLITVRIQKNMKEQAQQVFDNARFPITTAIRFFLIKVSKDGVFPFENSCMKEDLNKNLTTTMTLKISRKDKEQVMSAFKKLDISVSEAVGLFLHEVIENDGLPFEWVNCAGNKKINRKKGN